MTERTADPHHTARPQAGLGDSTSLAMSRDRDCVAPGQSRVATSRHCHETPRSLRPLAGSARQVGGGTARKRSRFLLRGTGLLPAVHTQMDAGKAAIRLSLCPLRTQSCAWP